MSIFATHVWLGLMLLVISSCGPSTLFPKRLDAPGVLATATVAGSTNVPSAAAEVSFGAQPMAATQAVESPQPANDNERTMSTPASESLPTPSIVLRETPEVQPTLTAVPTARPELAATASDDREKRVDSSSVAELAGAYRRLWRGSGATFIDGSLEGLAMSDGAIRLAAGPSGYPMSGTLTSSVHEAAFPFDNAVLSWNAESPQGTSLRFELRARVGFEWTPWYVMGTWAANGGSSQRFQSDRFAQVAVDTLVLRQAAQAWQYRVALSSDGRATPALFRLNLAYADMRVARAAQVPFQQGPWVRDLDVPRYSQLDEDPAIAREICSPTSLSMVLNFYGKKHRVLDVAMAVRDHTTGIFGNWPLNVAYAGSLGFDAYVDRLGSTRDIEAEIALGRPVIISIRFRPGELPEAPITQTDGHLIVVRGFTTEGNPIVNDPIGSGIGEVRRVYKRANLENVWLGAGGIAYVLRP